LPEVAPIATDSPALLQGAFRLLEGTPFLGWAALGLALLALGALARATLRKRRTRGAPPRRPIEARAAPADPDAELRLLIAEGELERAGDLRAGQRRFADALSLYLRAERFDKAARCQLELKQPVEAAELFARAGRLAEAAHHFQLSSAWKRAAECLQTLGSDREAAEMYERAGEPGRAAEILRGLGDLQSAARLFERAARPADAATALLARPGADTDAALQLRAADLFEAAGDTRRAAECLAAGGGWMRAAPLFEQQGEMERAARAYERAGAHARAGECFERAGLLPAARAHFERAGDALRAAEIAARLGNSLEAARGFYRVGAYEKAIELLQSIPPADADHREGAVLLARIFTEKGLFERARLVLEPIVPERSGPEDDLALLSLLAEVCERGGQPVPALRWLERIVDVDPRFEDAGRRLESLQEKVWGTTAAPTGAGLRYTLQREIGRGGMGVVYLANDQELERLVAIKFLPSELASHAAAVKMFRYEAKAAAAMNHPNIVHVYDVTVLDERPCMVMEFVSGKTARELMRVGGTKQRRPLPVRQVAEIARDICEALDYAHRRQVIHRDVKPGNIILDETERAKLMDFGISKVLQSGVEGLTQAKGTPQYMPPEQILGRDVDGRTDLYALGITIFEIATGRRPFRGEDVVHQQLHSPMPDPRVLNPEVPEALVRIIRRACEKDPDHRFQSAREMGQSLRALLE
jgi:tetratricopeptide (TPR) repeat protein